MSQDQEQSQQMTFGQWVVWVMRHSHPYLLQIGLGTYLLGAWCLPLAFNKDLFGLSVTYSVMRDTLGQHGWAAVVFVIWCLYTASALARWHRTHVVMLLVLSVWYLVTGTMLLLGAMAAGGGGITGSLTAGSGGHLLGLFPLSVLMFVRYIVDHAEDLYWPGRGHG